MGLLILIFVCAILSNCNTIESNRTPLESKIVGGWTGRLSYMVFLKSIKYPYECSGCLISDEHVLTAAHCLIPHRETYHYGELVVVVGSNCIECSGTFHTIKSLDYHPHFDFRYYHNATADIGIITLNVKVELSLYVSYLTLPMFDFPSGIEAIVSGWGSEQEVHEEDCIIFLSENMKILKVRTISNEECQSLHEVINIDETHICAVSENKSENASKGDSGSPLVYNGIVIGIVSKGIEVDTSIPAVYTRVYPYLKYIKAITNQAHHFEDDKFAASLFSNLFKCC